MPLLNIRLVPVHCLWRSLSGPVLPDNPEEWRRTSRVTRDGQLYFDASYVFGCLKNAAAVYTRSGRTNIQNNVVATLQVTSDKVLLDRYLPNSEMVAYVICDLSLNRRESKVSRCISMYVVWSIQQLRVVMCDTASLSSPGWTATFGILWDKTIVSRSEMEAVLVDAGRLVGLGNGRRIGMGRSEVTDIVITE